MFLFLSSFFSVTLTCPLPPLKVPCFSHFRSCTFSTQCLSLPSSHSPPPPSFPHALCMCLCHVVDCPSFWPLQYVRYMEKKTLWWACWVGLKIFSVVGLGTGLHTFLLYLVRDFLHMLPTPLMQQLFTFLCWFMTQLKPSDGSAVTQVCKGTVYATVLLLLRIY